MSYMHIDNLYKNKEILLFKKCYAMEKIHGTSAHISFTVEEPNQGIKFFAGGEKHEKFLKLFDSEKLTKKFEEAGLKYDVTIFGEAYGGKCQGMSETYGKELKFIAFEVRIGENFLPVPQAEAFVKSLELEFVHYEEIETDIDIIDKLCGADSVQAVRNGIGEGKLREGIVLRPLIEAKNTYGERIMSKHKNDTFSERAHQPKVKKKIDLKVLEEAEKIADEWVTDMRLTHVLDKINDPSIENTGKVIKAMLEDVYREAKGEIVESNTAKKAITIRTARMFKTRLKSVLHE